MVTPETTFWCDDIVSFHRKLEKDFVLIPLELFGLQGGFCACDVQRKVLPVCFQDSDTSQACFLYIAHGSKKKEVQQMWDKDTVRLELDEDFQVCNWGQVVRFLSYHQATKSSGSISEGWE